MKLYCLFLLSICISFASLMSGCNSETLPGAIIDDNEPTVESSFVQLEASVLHPASVEPGGEVTVHRGAGTFPSGFYRVTFSGGAETNFFMSGSSTEVTITVPQDALSGPFGFTVGAAPANDINYGGPTADTFRAYAVKSPGIVVNGSNNFTF